VRSEKLSTVDGEQSTDILQYKSATQRKLNNYSLAWFIKITNQVNDL